ncbi:hypothetical protein NVIRPANT_00191 [Pantoea sp. Nvir]|nr:hypothetical protein NVIRPANT_00191 [Pantoea sp. Nvir]
MISLRMHCIKIMLFILNDNIFKDFQKQPSMIQVSILLCGTCV